MHGLNCGHCPSMKNYGITAYEIAKKHGFAGTEAEWINTLQSVYVARVTEKGTTTWSCNVPLETLVAQSALREIHLVTLDGKTAFSNKISEDMVVFRTLTYELSGGKLFDEYTLTEDGGTFATVAVEDIDDASITRSMLSNDVQTSLANIDTLYPMFHSPGSKVTIYDLDQFITDALQRANNALQPADQADWTPGYTEQIAVDDEGRLWGLAHGESAADDSNLFVEMQYYDGEYYATLNAEEILQAMEDAALAGKHRNVILIDRYRRQCPMNGYPDGDPAVAKFWTLEESGSELIIYSVAANGIVTTSTVYLGS
jgi:hypothetical protein